MIIKNSLGGKRNVGRPHSMLEGDTGKEKHKVGMWWVGCSTTYMFVTQKQTMGW